jgi:predicted short-subunit dehydrogenase-like oxidoreductase (DUF2520 family)
LSETIGIVGAGRVGQALGHLLRLQGERIVGVVSRNPVHAREAAHFIGPGVETRNYSQLVHEANAILVAVADDAVSDVAERLAGAGISRGTVIHTAGVYGPEVLDVLADRGVACGSVHPLQTIATPEQGVTDLPGSWFAVAAEDRAREVAERWVRLLRGNLLSVAPGGKSLYHAAAVMVGNYTAALLEAALVLMQEAGVPRDDARRALAPLMKAGVENALSQGPATALTGPIARGDGRTIRRHLDAMTRAEISETVMRFYRAAGMQTADLAGQRGLSTEKVRALEQILKGEANETGSSPRLEGHEGQG